MVNKVDQAAVSFRQATNADYDFLYRLNVAALREYGPRYSSELFNVNVLKLHGGSPDGYTSALLEPYSDRPGFYGETSYSPEAQKAAALAVALAGC